MEYKNKTKLELKDDLMAVRVFTILFVVLFIFTFFLFIIESQRALSLREQLQECQENAFIFTLFKTYAPFRTEHSFSFWTNHTGEWENYVVHGRVLKEFYRNGREIYFDCKIENNVWTQEDVIESYLCGLIQTKEHKR